MKRWLRRIAIGCAVVMVGCGLFGLLLPTLIGWGLGRGTLLSYVAGQAGQPVGIGGLDLAWFGNQRVDGLRVGDDQAGGLFAHLNVHVDASLWQLLTTGPRGAVATVGGVVQAEMRSSGASVQDTPATLAALLPFVGVELRFDMLDISVMQSDPSQPLALRNLVGKVRFDAQRVLAIDARAEVDSAELTGALECHAELAGALGGDGSFTPAGARLIAELQAPQLALPALGEQAELRSVALRLNSDDLARSMSVELTGESHMADHLSPLQGQLTWSAPFDAQGRVQFDVARLSGAIRGRRLPAVALQPVVASTPCVLARDVGSYVDVVVQIAKGASRAIEVSVLGDVATLDAAGTIDVNGGLISGQRLRLQGHAHPEWAPQLRAAGLNAPSRFAVQLQSFQMPTRVDSEWLAHVQATGELQFDGPLQVSASQGSVVTVAGLDATIDVDGPRAVAGIKGQLRVDNHPLHVDLQLHDFGARNMTVSGMMASRELPADTLLRHLPQQAGNVLRPILASSVDVDLQLREDPVQGAKLHVISGDAEATATLSREDDLVTIDAAGVKLDCPPQVLSTLLGEADAAVRLLGPVRGLWIELERRTSIDTAALAGWADVAVALPIRFGFESADILLPDLSDAPYRVRRVQGAGQWTAPRSMLVSLRGHADISQVSSGTALGTFTYALKSLPGQSGPTTWSAQASCGALTLGALQPVLPESAIEWLGHSASVDADLQWTSPGWQATVRGSTDSLRGDWQLTIDPQAITCAAERATLALPLERMQGWGLAAPRGGDANGELVMQADIRTARLPMALLRDRPFDPTAVNIDVTCRLPKVRITDAAGGVVRDTELQLFSDDLAAGLRVAGMAVVEADKGRESKTKLDVQVDQLVDGGGLLNLKSVRFDGQFEALDLPLTLLDQLLSSAGLIESALGQRGIITLRADELSSEGGSAYARLRSNNGRLTLPELRARDGRLVLEKKATATLTVTTALRERLLRKIHPLFADLHTSADPLTLEIHDLAVPFDGDVRRLNARFDMAAAKVRFRPSALVLGVLAVAGARGDGKTVPGRIEDVHVSIRGGVVRYERFKIHIEDYFLVYSGSVDLKTGRLNLRHEVPVAALAADFPELAMVPEHVAVPILTRGTLDEPITEIAPDFLLNMLQDPVRIIEDILGIGRQPTEDKPQDGPVRKKKRTRPR